MRTRFASGRLAVLLPILGLLLAPLPSRAESLDSIPPTGRLDFSVYRGDTRIGHHRYRFEQAAGTLSVEVDIELVVRFALIPVYRYTHRSRETWREGRLIALESRTHDNGRDLAVTAGAAGDKLRIRGSAGELAVPLGTRPGSHWNAANLRDKSVFDTQTGALIAIDVVPKGSDRIARGDGRPAIAARRAGVVGYEIKEGVRGSAPWLDLDVWYDGSDVLAALAFHFRGYDILYVLD